MPFRPIYVTAPLAVVLGIASAVLYLNAQPASMTSGLEADSRHPVTDPMRADAEARARKVAPFFERTDAADNKVVIGGTHPRPQFIYAVKEGCPCSFDAEPLLQRLYKHLDGKVDFVSVINRDQEGAKKWSSAMLPPYPVVSDLDLKVVDAYKFDRSVYGALVDPEGRVVKVWPGYSKSILKDMNEEMSAAAGLKVKPFDPMYAPTKDTAGCMFREE